jgi:non-ribosomal peptide synthetase component E (peptide arylation enzyme)
MINRGGESISAAPIEGLIAAHPGVKAVAVIAMPDPLMGERVCAYIQPNSEVQLSFEEIISFLKDMKASVLQFPERIEFIQDMPLTAAEKIDKKVLQLDIQKKISVEKV